MGYGLYWLLQSARIDYHPIMSMNCWNGSPTHRAFRAALLLLLVVVMFLVLLVWWLCMYKFSVDFGGGGVHTAWRLQYLNHKLSVLFVFRPCWSGTATSTGK